MNIIKKIYYNNYKILNRDRNGFLYKSVLEDQFYNLALKPEYAKEVLEISEIYYCANFFGYSGIGTTIFILAKIDVVSGKLLFTIPTESLKSITTTSNYLNVDFVTQEIGRVMSKLDFNLIKEEQNEILKLNVL